MAGRQWKPQWCKHRFSFIISYYPTTTTTATSPAPSLSSVIVSLLLLTDVSLIIFLSSFKKLWLDHKPKCQYFSVRKWEEAEQPHNVQLSWSLVCGMIKVHNDTTNGYFIMMTLPYMDEIIIITIVMAIWVFSIMQFFRFVYDSTSTGFPKQEAE